MSSPADRAIRSICVAGGGIVAVSAAAAFARALPRTAVTLVELPAGPAATGELAPTALGAAAQFHALVGIDELGLVASGAAIHHLGTIFDDWGEERWVHALGACGKSAGTVPFDQIWTRARSAGRARPFHHHSAAAMLAEAGKFVHSPRDRRSPLADLAYGLRLDPLRYRAQLLEPLRTLQFAQLPGPIVGVEPRGDGGIAALVLGSGRRIECDLYVDCAGPGSDLAPEAPDFESWGGMFPFDRLAISAMPEAGLATADRVTGTRSGWNAIWASPGRSIAACAFSSGSSESPADAIGVRAGRRLRPFTANVLALGEAAATLDPLHRLDLDLAHRSILLALELLPGRDCNPLELAEYNRRIGLATERVRDFLALHYVGRGCDRSALSESALHILDQYGHRGRLPFFEEQSLSRDSWAAMLLGTGILPRHADPLAAGVPLDQAAAAMDRLAAELAEIARRAPDYRAYAQRMIATSKRPISSPPAS